MTNTLRFFMLLLCVFPYTGHTQLPETDPLYRTLMQHDSLLFQSGYNHCNLPVLQNLLDTDFEFYHDSGGTQNTQTFMQAFRNGLCRDTLAYRARRVLIPGSTELYPLYDKDRLYGVIQNGRHAFYETGTGTPETFGSTARFTHLWLLRNGSWKLSRSLSFDHNTDPKRGSAAAQTDDDEINALLHEHHIPVLGLGLIEDGQLQQLRVYGHLKPGTAAPYHTVFNVASLTKPVTALVALQLVNQGKWKLDEPLARYFTDADVARHPYAQKLTTRHVLSHTTGFPNWRWNLASKKLEFEAAPGTCYGYSGEGFEYLRKALEKKFRKPLNQLAKELLFTKLNMTDTDYIQTQAMDASRFAAGYDAQGAAYVPVQNNPVNAADDLHTTLADYGTFLCFLLNGAGLTPELYAEMTQAQVATQPHKAFGLGLERYELDNGDFALAHGGSDEGTRCIFFLLPKTRRGLLIFTNSDNGHLLYEKLIVKYLGAQGKRIVEIETGTAEP